MSETKNKKDKILIVEEELCPACGEHTLEMKYRGKTVISEYCKTCHYSSER